MYKNIETNELIQQMVGCHNRVVQYRKTWNGIRLMDEYYRDHMMIELRKRGVDVDYTTLGKLQQKCVKCGIRKPYGEFHKDKRKLSGYRKICKRCRK